MSPGAAISVTGIDDSWTAIRISASSSSLDIGRVTLTGSRTGSTPLELFIAGAGCVPSAPDLPIPSNQVAGSSWSGLTYGANSDSVRDAVRLVAAIGGDLTGTVDCGTIFRLQVGGDIAAGVTTHAGNITGTGGHDAMAYVRAQGVSNDGDDLHGSLTAHAGDLGVLEIGSESTPGNLDGPVAVEQGGIARVAVAGDVNATTGDSLAARHGIRSIVANNLIGVIRANAFGGDGIVSRIDANGLYSDLYAHGLGPVSGITARIAVRYVKSGRMMFEHDVDAPIVVEDPQFGDPSPDASSAILIGGDLHDNITLKEYIGTVRIDGAVGRPDRQITIRVLPPQDSTDSAPGVIGSLRVGEASEGSVVQFPLNIIADQIDELIATTLYATIDGNPSRGHAAFGHVAIENEAGGQWHVNGENSGMLLQVGGLYRGTTHLHNGLAGQVVLGSADCQSAPCGAWSGVFFVHTGTGNLAMSPEEPQPGQGPLYDATPAELGGGSIGAARYFLHHAACEPAYDGPGGDVPAMLTSEFQHQSYGSGECPPLPDVGGPIAEKTIILRAYGPVRAESSTSPPVTIRRVNPSGGYDSVAYEDAAYTSITLEAPSGSAFVREIHIRGLETQNLIEGVYHILPKLTGTDRLLCDGLLTTDPVPFGEDFTVEIELRADCNRNGVWDADDIAEELLLDMWRQDGPGSNGKIDCCEPCDPDYNQDGNADQDDVAYLVNVIGGGSNPSGWNPDYNRDGNADQDDTAALVNTIGGGGCP